MSNQHEMWNDELLSAYLDGECTAEERAQVEAQLAASPALQQVLGEIEATRVSVRALPAVDGPPEFWARLLDGPGLDAVADTDPTPDPAPVVDLAERQTTRVPRWVVAAGGAVAAAVVAVVIFVPQPQQVSPPVGTFTDAHNVRSSLDADAVGSLVPLGLQGGFRR